MFCPPSIHYDPEHPEPQDGEGYQRWVETYSAQNQFDYTSAGNISQVAYQQTQPHASIVPDMNNGASHSQVQNPYGFVAGQFMPSSNPQENSYARQFAQGRPGERQTNISHMSAPQRYPQQDQQLNPLPVDYQQRQFVPQHTEQYVQHQQSTNTSHDMPYYFQSTPSEYVGDPGQQAPQAFTFTHYAAGSEHLSTPNSTYPSPDPTSFASSMSPSSKAGTDDGQSHHSFAPGTSPQPSNTQPLQPTVATTASSSRLVPHQPATAKRGRAAPGAAKGKGNPTKRRKRSEHPADSDSGTDEDDFISSNSVVPPLKGPVNVTARLKREYLLAQIRQKDAVIESLLKQLHNPYLATPLSVASYRMATSPSDKNNGDVLAWLDRLEASVRTAGKPGGAKAFGLGSRVHAGEADDHSDGESDRGDQQDPTEQGTVVGEHQVGEGAGEVNDASQLQQVAPDDSVPMGLIANLSLNNPKKKHAKHDEEESEDDDDVGFANETYFQPVLHTPASTFTRCPFLFTVVCAIASRYYEKSEIYPIAMHFAKHAAANALITGWKSVELAQAYILLSVFTVPERRWEEHRGWLYIGLAARLATDLNLHQVSPVKPTSERQEREMLNRTRLWLNCYNLDRSTATQYGKPYSIKEDYVIHTSANWYTQSKYNGPYDIGICAYTAMLRVVSRFHDQVFSDLSSPSGLNLQLDFLELTTLHDNYLSQFYEEWTARFANDSDLSGAPSDMHVASGEEVSYSDFDLRSDPACAFRENLLPFLTSYARLVMWSFGFQQAYRRGIQGRDRVFLDKCYKYATTVVTCMIDKLAPSGYIRFSPDGHFVFATFASAFLLKLLKPEFSGLITQQQHDDIFDMIGRLIQTFSSTEIAIDERHTPKLHARFLTTLLSKHRKDVSAANKQSQQPPPQSQTASPGSGGSHTHSAPSPEQQQQSYQSGDLGPSQQHPPGTTGMSQGQPTYENYGYSTVPSQPQAQPQPQYTAEPMVEGFDDEMLGAIQVLKTPGYWQTMMMPGFQWTETQLRPTMQSIPVSYHQSGMMQPGRNAMQAAGMQYT
ncbi:hypothetical protein EUX98_g1452 [Antrodiella citrinella]|uniref:Xylanolytic transcriptional activator regulatory domain-containing protein n=1 Tax=Antrodiella citrinella TaxID=2447956 RepID=A0A4S4N3T5_9APHY|nr:hypothetical protein EUX98_g1452 [Antrodiella citrinella]